MQQKKILVADDDINILASLQYVLSEEGFDITAVTTPEAAIDNVKQQNFDLVLLDMNFVQDTTSGREGLALVKDITALELSLPIIVMTGWATVDIAVEAMQAGARDFIQKPWHNERLISAIALQIDLATSAKKNQRLVQQNKLLTSQVLPSKRDGVIANSPVMQQLLASLDELAQSDMSILLTGDNGTGKSMLAAYVHSVSKRADNAFVAVNMGAIPESLFESEMFGHRKGAFTDAKENRIGRFEMAEQGTLFLDELANIPLAQQAKLLRVLEEKQFEVVGASKSIDADVRVISATNCDLLTAIADKEFRQDLYYRLNTIELRVPSLNERKEDIVPLAQYFLQSFSNKYHRTCPALSRSAAQSLEQHSWPGNIRELSHLMERVLFTCKSGVIESSDLMLAPVVELHRDSLDSPELTLDEIEKQALINRLKQCQGNATETAKSLGLSRSGYYRRLSKYGLD
ncbi:sigma-54 dependent transcriptional regulator [Psychrobium sp. 1_MG-2023]|uniref:sigma-54-dependent transcriptional regulator n=1 Tax=Psychrobium sp. 1_MG-2023 TaxID=3062624 RepID=UPI000C31F7D4|nr:sigma-54 dependent transcriptional regulator [Psychrobium sp. 1_MG-2023]MDP2562589.1 sigma-54 dependent transcriptional regulator [Psychrobium sp. 1_MG-2023]PKF59784.1 sigma-54-dependent Fis family transcriptional regulator [Alteromonadales bacterium alter-6D02]